MIGRALYAVWTAAVLAVVVFVQYADLASPDGTREPRTNPTSLRDNPGAYRSAYTTSGRVLRGK